MPTLPKPAHLRQRRNRTSTAASLVTAERARRTAPKLPEGVAWHPLTIAFLRSTWRSPMASEFLSSDVPGLVMLTRLVDLFWTKPTAALAGEIRLQGQRFGLSPLDRRRLQWEVERGETAERKRTSRAPKPAEGDARAVLRALS